MLLHLNTYSKGGFIEEFCISSFGDLTSTSVSFHKKQTSVKV